MAVVVGHREADTLPHGRHQYSKVCAVADEAGVLL
jgi:ribosomal protein L1